MNCDECRWFDPSHFKADRFNVQTQTWKFTQVGVCRRLTPRQLAIPETGEVNSNWPKVESKDWCGEWEDCIDDSPETVSAIEGEPERRWSEWEEDHALMRELAKIAKERGLDQSKRPALIPHEIDE